MKKGLTPVKQVRYLTGFTIVELIIVIAIIGILATIATVSFARSKMRARDSIRVTDLNSVAQALLVYKEANNGTFPPNLCPNSTLGNLVSYFNIPCGTSLNGSLTVLVTGGYLSSLPETTTHANISIQSVSAAGSGLPHDPKLDPSDPKSDYWYYNYKPLTIEIPILAAKLEIPNSKGWAPYESGIPPILADCVQKSQSSGSGISDSSQPVITYSDPVRYCVKVAPY